MNQDTQSLEALLRALRVLLTGLLALVVLAVVAIDGVAYASAGSSAPLWALVPAGVLMGLLILLRVPQPASRFGAALLLALYVCSMAFFGWRQMLQLYAAEGPYVYDLFKAALIVLLAVPSLMPRRLPPGTRF